MFDSEHFYICLLVLAAMERLIDSGLYHKAKSLSDLEPWTQLLSPVVISNRVASLKEDP